MLIVEIAVETEVITRIWERGRRVWPRVGLTRELLAVFVAERYSTEGAAALEVPPERDEDLYLACACAAGDAAAVAAFDRRHAGDVEAALAGMALPSDLRDEVKQRLREKLFVAVPGDTPRIASYAGRGPLGGWVRAVAVRLAIDLLRGERADEVPAEEALLDALADDDADPEAEILKERYREEVNCGFADAFAALSPRQRNLLRQHFVHGLNIDQIGAMYGVHRVTAFRWIARARHDLLVAARGAVAARIGGPPGESESMLRLLRSRLHVSLDRLLRTDAGDGG